MADPIDLITADPDINKPDEIEAQLDLFLTQLKVRIPQFNAAILALNLNDVSDTSASSISIDLTTGKTATVSSGKGFLPGGYLILADSAAPTANSMVIQIVSYVGTTLTFDPVTIEGGGTKSDWVISFSAKPQPAVGDHEIYMTTPNGHGLVDLNIRGYSVTQRSVGTAFSHAYTADNGSVFTILENGKYDIQVADVAGVTGHIGISLNSSELSTNVKIITASSRLCIQSDPITGQSLYTAAQGVTLSVGDKIRAHTNRSLNSASISGWIRIVKKQAL